MRVQRLSVKLFAEGSEGFDPATLIPVFHDWIRNNALPDRLLIDVADYRHVPEGPGVMLVAHEAHYALDSGGGRLGLVCSRRRDAPEEAARCLPEAFRDALRACRLIEQEPRLPLRFAGGEFRLQVHSRLVAPNTPETFAAFRPELDAFTRTLYGEAPCTVTHLGDPRRSFGVHVKSETQSSVEELLQRVA